MRARVVYRGARGAQFHRDPHTREFLRLGEARGVRTLRLNPTSPEKEAVVDQYTYSFARSELPALIDVFEGDVSLATGDPVAAEAHFRSALARLNVQGEASDHCLTRLAKALRWQDKDEEARALLRHRAADPLASAEVLFALATTHHDGALEELDDEERRRRSPS